MRDDLIALSIPFFFLFMAIEWFVSFLQSKPVYRFNDSLSNLNNGTGEQVVNVAQKILFILAYEAIYRRSPFRMSVNSYWVWFALFLGVDFFFYWFHRATHRINFLWATHVAHHQSEDFNLAVALRQSWFQGFFAIVFYLPLAFAGFPTEPVIAMIAIDTVLQFWIHTRLIKRLPFLFEFVLNTPSHHRVHHGRNPKYLDKNYGAALIIWDRLFGTFQVEEEEPVYGIVKPLNGWGVLKSNFHYWFELMRLSRQKQGLKEKVKVWLVPPEVTGSQPPEVDAKTITKYNVMPDRLVKLYLFLQFVAAVIILMALLKHTGDWSGIQQIFVGAFIVWGLVDSGALLERRPGAVFSETARLVAGAGLLFCFQTLATSAI